MFCVYHKYKECFSDFLEDIVMLEFFSYDNDLMNDVQRFAVYNARYCLMFITFKNKDTLL